MPVEIEVDSPFQVREKTLEWQISQMRAEIIRLRLKCGEEISLDEILMGFANPAGGFAIKRSANWPE